MKEAYKFSVSISDYWKKEYEKIKSSLTAKDLPKGSKRLLEALQTNLRQLPDSYRSLQLLPQVDFKFGAFATDYAKVTEILKAISGERRGENMDDKRNTILIYSSQLLHPGKENFYFVEKQNGIELLVPGIYLYLFFPIEEVNLIAAFIEYLAKNFINLTKNFSSNKEKQTIIKPEVISQNDRKAIIKKLSPEEFNKKKIKEFADKRIRYLADSYDIKIQIVYEKEDVLICSEKDLEMKKGIDWKIRINQSEIIYEPESLLNKIDQQFKKMSANMVKTFV